MDCNQFKSVVALVDSLVRSAQARRSHQLLSSLPVPAPVPRKSLTDFSICSILGLETDVTQSSSTSGKLKYFEKLSGSAIGQRRLDSFSTHLIFGNDRKRWSCSADLV